MYHTIQSMLSKIELVKVVYFLVGLMWRAYQPHSETFFISIVPSPTVRLLLLAQDSLSIVVRLLDFSRVVFPTLTLSPCWTF